MVLIIDTFEVPSSLISKKLFRSEEVTELKEISTKIIDEVLSSDVIYCIHKECFGCDEIRSMRYYFNKVVEVLVNVQYVNKSKKSVRYYSAVRDAGGIVCDLVEIRNTEMVEEVCDKTAFLPHIRAQSEEIVIFPSDED